MVQTQVFFTIGFSMFFAKERLKLYQAVAVSVSMTGLGIIALHTDANTTFLSWLGSVSPFMVITGQGAWRADG